MLASIVEKWAAEHPRKTRMQDFLEKFPKAEMDEEDGVPKICAKRLGYTIDCPESFDYVECWNMPVEE